VATDAENKVIEAACDYKLACENAEFAALYGDAEKIKLALFSAIQALEIEDSEYDSGG
jgi:hypothetical protein